MIHRFLNMKLLDNPNYKKIFKIKSGDILLSYSNKTFYVIKKNYFRKITLEKILKYRDIKKLINLKYGDVICPLCNGNSIFNFDECCKRCLNTGKLDWIEYIRKKFK